MYHTRAGANSVGSVVWDLLYVMKDFDPKHVGFHWDTGHMSHHGSNTWELLMRTAGPYVVGDELEGSHLGAEPRVPR